MATFLRCLHVGPTTIWLVTRPGLRAAAEQRPSCKSPAENRRTGVVVLTAWREAEERGVVGLGGDDRDRHDGFRIDAFDMESPGHGGEDQGRFGQRELRANADTRAHAKG